MLWETNSRSNPLETHVITWESWPVHSAILCDVTSYSWRSRCPAVIWLLAETSWLLGPHSREPQTVVTVPTRHSLPHARGAYFPDQLAHQSIEIAPSCWIHLSVGPTSSEEKSEWTTRVLLFRFPFNAKGRKSRTRELGSFGPKMTLSLSNRALTAPDGRSRSFWRPPSCAPSKVWSTVCGPTDGHQCQVRYLFRRTHVWTLEDAHAS